MIGGTNKLYWTKLLFTWAFLIAGTGVMAQKAVLITGAVMDAEDRTPLQAVHVMLNNPITGTITDVNGHFSVLMNVGDTLTFTSIGYTKAVFILPHTTNKEHYTLLQLLKREDLVLEEVIILPWPEWEDFKKAFLETSPEGKEKKYNPEEIRPMGLERQSNLSKYRYEQMRYQQLYDLNGIIPPNNFLNPMSWSDFIYDLQKDLRKKKK